MNTLTLTVGSPVLVLVDGRGVIEATVTNTDAVAARVVLASVPVTYPSATAAPVTVANVERPQREIAPGGQEQYVVAVDASALEPGAYAIALAASPADQPTSAPVAVAAVPSAADPVAGTAVPATADAVASPTVITFVVEPRSPKPPRKLKWWWIAAPVCVVLVVLGAVFFLLPRGSALLAPDLEGKTVAQATSTLEADGLVIEVEERVSAPPWGEVIEQDPVAFTEVESDSIVRVVVPVGVRVPPVEELTQDEALAQVVEFGLVPVTSTQPTMTQVGLVISQSPAAEAQVEEGSVVNVVVGSQGVEMPSVFGSPVNEAYATLQAAGLAVSVDDCGIIGFCFWVTGQTPRGPAVVAPDTVVRLETGPVRLPDWTIIDGPFIDPEGGPLIEQAP